MIARSACAGVGFGRGLLACVHITSFDMLGSFFFCVFGDQLFAVRRSAVTLFWRTDLCAARSGSFALLAIALVE